MVGDCQVGVVVVLRRVLRGRWAAMSVAMAAAALASAAVLVQPLVAGRAVDEASHGGVSWRVLLLLAAAFVVAILAEAADTYLFYRLGEAVVFDRRRVYVTHLIAMPVAELDRLRPGDLVARATSDISELREVPRMVSRVVIGVCTLAVAGALMARIDAMLAAGVLGVVAASFFGGSLLLARAGRAAAVRQQAVGEHGARLERTLGAIRTVKMNDPQLRSGEAIVEAAGEARRAGMRLAWLGAVSAPVMRMTATGSLVMVLVVGATRVSDGVISVGELVTLFLLTLFSLAPLQDVYRGLTTLHIAAAADVRIEEVLAVAPERLDQTRPTWTGPVPSAIAETGEAPLVQACGVSFSYGVHQVLREVSFQLRHQQITAVVGPSGSGKSTLLALLCRFYEPDEGQLVFDGQPYTDLPLTELRRRITLVEQDSPVLHGSLRDNLVMGAPEATESEIDDVLRRVNLDTFVDGLPQGLDTSVLDRGRALSGGQRQRLAIARALLSPAELVLLDEPTAHLDRVNESVLVETLTQLREHRSVLIVAHRRSTIERADQILVVEHGHVRRVESFADLPDYPAEYRNRF